MSNQTVKFYNASIQPATDSGIDIGAVGKEFGSIWIDVMAYIDGLGESMLVDSNYQIQFRDTAIYISSKGDGHIDVDSDVNIDFNINGTEQVTIIDGVIQPTLDNDIDIGTSVGSGGYKIKNGYFHNINMVTYLSDVVVYNGDVVFY